MNFAIATTVSLMGCCVTLPLFFRYGYALNVSFFVKGLLFLVSLLVAALPVFAMPEMAGNFGKYTRVVQYVLYFIYVTAVILLVLTLFRDALWTIGALFFKSIPSPFQLHWLNVLNIITIGVALLCAGSALYQGMKVPRVKEQVIESYKIQQDKTVVVLSDIHLSRSVFPDKIKGLVERVNALNPDIIVLPGDTVDDDKVYTQPLLQILSRLKAKEGVYYTSGNHEFYVGYRQSMKQLESAGFINLDNAKVQFDSVCLAGVPDIPSAARYGVSVDWSAVCQNADQYRILLSHQPILPNETNSADLIISGHTHGGQIFPFHIFSWYYNSKLLAGLYEPKIGKNVYVSRGSGQWGPQMRFLAPSEITVLKLRRKLVE